ncbi:putative oxidoreductase,short chain dehydrogenase [Pestalotiopsis sp. NC0098]|nr:putative oxidoreductase,short chain dehydrogenase [Pestalotiopsis sp. NC0098]
MSDTFTVQASELTGIKNKVVLITGGSSGIGLATAQLVLSLADTNRVAILDRAEPPASLASSFSPDRILFHQCDLTSWTAQRGGFDAAIAKFGRIDAVLANVGLNEKGQQFFSDDLDAGGGLAEPDRVVLDVTFTANADTVKLAIHHLRKNENGGSIVMVSSFAGYLGNAGAPYYNASKHAIVGLLRSLKPEVPKVGVAISVVAPAITATPMLASVGVDAAETEARLSGAGVRINRVESVALAAAHLLNLGPGANGMGVLVQGDKMRDVERGYAKSRSTMLGEEMLDMFRQGSGKELYPRLKVESKI